MSLIETMVGGSVGIKRCFGRYIEIHTRLDMMDGRMWQVIGDRISDVRGVKVARWGDGYVVTVFLHTMFSMSEVMPQIKAIIAKYAPREYKGDSK